MRTVGLTPNGQGGYSSLDLLGYKNKIQIAEELGISVPKLKQIVAFLKELEPDVFGQGSYAYYSPEQQKMVNAINGLLANGSGLTYEQIRELCSKGIPDALLS